MPAKYGKQYRKAGAAAVRGEKWGKEMVKKTPPTKRKRWAKKQKKKKWSTYKRKGDGK